MIPNFAAYFSNGKVFIALWGDWKFLYNDMPLNVTWIKNDREGKKVTKDDIARSILKKETDLINTYVFSSDRCQKYFKELSGL